MTAERAGSSVGVQSTKEGRMSRRAVRLGALIGPVGAAAVLAAVLAATGSAQAPGERTFKLVEAEGSAAFGDVAPRSDDDRSPRFSGGDQKVFTSRVFDQSGRRVGRGDYHCIAVHGARTFAQVRFQCTGTVTLRDGTIAMSVAYGGNQREEDVALAVIGGTGAYEGARGQISARNLPSERLESTFHLLP
jgi:hypothetical protein